MSDPVVNPNFGAILRRTDVVNAVTETIKAWQREYLAEIERQTGREPHSLPIIEAWETSVDGIRKHVGSSLPCVVVRCPGLLDQPMRRKGGTDARFGVIVSVVVNGTDQADAEEIADTYCAALRALLEQKGDLGGFASGMLWTDETYGEIPSKDRDTIGAGSSIWTVTVNDVVRSKGPSGDPLSDPYGSIRGAVATASAVGSTLTPTTDPLTQEDP